MGANGWGITCVGRSIYVGNGCVRARLKGGSEQRARHVPGIPTALIILGYPFQKLPLRWLLPLLGGAAADLIELLKICQHGRHCQLENRYIHLRSEDPSYGA